MRAALFQLLMAVLATVSQAQVPTLLTAEYFFNVDPGPGNGLPLPCADGNCDEAFETAMANIVAPAQAGAHRLFVRARGTDGTWGPVRMCSMEVVPPMSNPLTSLVAGEYFFDADPGAGNGTAFQASDGAYDEVHESANVNVPLNLSLGPHMLGFRLRGTDGAWGPVRSKVIEVVSASITFTLDLRVALQGCMGSTFMNNTLRNSGLVPLIEPYTDLGYDLGPSAGESTSSTVLNVVFPPGASVVDWVLLEFRPTTAPDQITASIPALLRRGGTVSATDGSYPFLMELPYGSYHVVVRHRNHLPISTAMPIDLNSSGQTVAIDFMAGATSAFGTSPQVLVGSFHCMWAGDVSGDGFIKYTGSGNDRDPILLRVGGTIPTNTVSGYLPEDINMDGVVKYTGTNNDRDPILVNIGGTVPTNVRSVQLP